MPIMRGMNSNCIDLIYLDPPFNSKANYAAPIGSMAAGAEFKDTWTLSDVDVAWLDLLEAKYPALNRVIHAAMTNSDKAYLIYMAVRMLEMKRILKPNGSIYLHCDPTMSHYLKLVMDAIFGRKNLRNEVVWCYTGPGSPNMKQFNRKHDVIFWYAKGDRWVFNRDAVRVPYKDPKQRPRKAFDTGDSFTDENIEAMRSRGKVPEDWWEFRVAVRSPKERTGYPTQKPLNLLDRIIKASSPKGGVVFDPFCGCATTLVAADRLQRNWVGIDISPKAVELVNIRIKQDQGLFQEIVARKDIPERTDVIQLKPYNSIDNKKFLYGEQEGHCKGCGTHFEMRNLTVDHIIARSVGGTDHLDNLQLLCGNCNSIKGNRGQEYLLARMEGRKVAYA